MAKEIDAEMLLKSCIADKQISDGVKATLLVMCKRLFEKQKCYSNMLSQKTNPCAYIRTLSLLEGVAECIDCMSEIADEAGFELDKTDGMQISIKPKAHSKHD